jgi:hypothetical protein
MGGIFSRAVTGASVGAALLVALLFAATAAQSGTTGAAPITPAVCPTGCGGMNPVCLLGSPIATEGVWVPVMEVNAPWGGSATGTTGTSISTSVSFSFDFVDEASSTGSYASSTIGATNGDSVALFEAMTAELYAPYNHTQISNGPNPCQVKYTVKFVTPSSGAWTDNDQIAAPETCTCNIPPSVSLTDVQSGSPYYGQSLPSLALGGFGWATDNDAGTQGFPTGGSWSQSVGQQTVETFGTSISFSVGGSFVSVSGSASEDTSQSSQTSFTYSLPSGLYGAWYFDQLSSSGAMAFYEDHPYGSGLSWSVAGSSTTVQTCGTCSVSVSASGGTPSGTDYVLFSGNSAQPPVSPTQTGCISGMTCPPTSFNSAGDLSGTITFNGPPPLFYAWLYDVSSHQYSNMITFRVSSSDGSGTSFTSSASSGSVTITTQHGGDTLILAVVVSINSGYVTGCSDGAGLYWYQRDAYTPGAGGHAPGPWIFEWTAFSPNALSSDVVTCKLSVTANIDLLVAGFGGELPDNQFDPGSGVPCSAGGTTSVSCSLTTSTEDLVVATAASFYTSSYSINTGTGFTQVSSLYPVGPYAMMECELVSGAGTYTVSASDSNSIGSSILADGIMLVAPV